MTTAKQMQQHLREAWAGVADEGYEILLSERLAPCKNAKIQVCRPTREEVTRLRQDTYHTCNDRKETWAWIRRHQAIFEAYSLDRLRWVTEAPDILADCGKAPPGFPFWAVFRLLRGPRPKGFL